jgi:predicted transport protein
MSDIKLFRITKGQASELQGAASDLEKPMQNLIEANLNTFLGIRFLASEYATGKTHGGRIDSLGLDENHCPVIIEYKRSVGENVINQGLYYLDWLMDHQAEFKLLVLEKVGKAAADAIDWSAPRLVCIAADFTKYDGHAVQQINRNIELIRYRRFDNELLLLELANASSAALFKAGSPKAAKASKSAAAVVEVKPLGPDKSYAEVVASMPEALIELLVSLEDYILSLGDDVQVKELRLYVAFKRLKNFATLVPQQKRLMLYLHLDPSGVLQKLPQAKDVSAKGHWGTGDVEFGIATQADLEAVKPFIAQAYEGLVSVQ